MANIEGHGAPRGNTIGVIGDKYTDLDTGVSYECIGIYASTTTKLGVKETFYDWRKIISNSSGFGEEVTRDSIKKALGYIPVEPDEVSSIIQSVVGTLNLTWTDGGYISVSDGSVMAEEGSSYSDFVSVSSGSRLYVCNTMTEDVQYNVFYDADRKYLSSFSTEDGAVITVPENAAYLRLSKYTSADVAIVPEVMMQISTALGVIENGTY